MWTGLSRDGYAALLSPADELHRSTRAHVAEVHVTACAAGEENVADGHDLLGFGGHAFQAEAGADDTFVHRSAHGEGGLLAVIGHGNTKCTRVLERRAHEMS